MDCLVQVSDLKISWYCFAVVAGRNYGDAYVEDDVLAGLGDNPQFIDVGDLVSS
jgi:hypothetical protein